MNSKTIEETSVVVVGGSLVGLSAALFLAARGVPTIVVEPHLGSHPHPRAIGYTQRTLELFRTVGVAERIPEAPESFRLARVKCDALAGTWQTETAWTPARSPQSQAGPAAGAAATATTAAAAPPAPHRGAGQAPVTPHRGAAIAQDKLEPILRERARELGAQLQLGTELVSFTQDADGVTLVVRDRAPGAASAPDHDAAVATGGGAARATIDGERDAGTRTIRAKYVIAADGAKSGVRDALGIGRTGRGYIRTVRSVLFRADLDAYLARGVHQFEIEQPDLRAFLTTYNDGRWVLMFLDDRDRDDAEVADAIRRAIGRADIPFEIVARGRWELAALVADRFAEGRVFLAGDAAHQLPPTRGGFGANTGIHDAYDLAWKLAAVLAGTSAPRLLDTYDAERRPIAWERLRQTFARPDYAREANGIADGVAILDDLAMELGALVRSTAVLGAGPELPAAAHPDAWRGQPGTRAPHRWLDAGQTRSTLDLFGRDWVLVTADAEAWRAAATASGLALAALPADLARDAFGLGTTGASLVRPDGIVAWRAADAARTADLDTAFATVAARDAR